MNDNNLTIDFMFQDQSAVFSIVGHGMKEEDKKTEETEYSTGHVDDTETNSFYSRYIYSIELDNNMCV